MGRPVRALIIEDTEAEVGLIVQELQRNGYDLTYSHVNNAADMKTALETEQFDIVLSDYSLPGIDALSALNLLNEQGIDIPFIIITGTIGIETAVAAMKAGAHDFFLKSKMSRLVPAIERELREAEDRRRRHWAETELRKSEQRFSKIFHSGPITITVSTLDGVIRDVNDHFLLRYGYARDEVIDHNSLDLGLWADPADRLKVVAMLQKSSTLSDLEFRFCTKSREMRYTICSFAIIDILNDTCILTMSQDITERRQMQENLQYHAKLLENVAEAVISTDIDDHIRSWNPAASRIYGWQADEVVNQSTITILQTEFLDSSAAETINELETLGQWKGEVNQHRKDGTIVNIMSSVSVVTDDSGERIGIVAVNRDITEFKRINTALQRAENRFTTIFHRSPVPTKITQLPDSQIVDVNYAFIELFGYERDELIGRTVLELGLWVNPEERAQHVNNVFESNSVQNFETDGRTKSGDILHLLASADQIDLGGAPHMVTLLYDMTELKNLEQEVLEAERLRIEIENERELIQLKERFISVVSHEFRTPLSVITTSAGLIDIYYDRLSQDEQLKHIHSIQAQAEDMVGLLDDVLTVNKARAGRLDFNPAPLDFISFCQTMLEHIQSIDNDQHNLIFTHEGELSAVVLDSKLLKHIVINLLSNATKYSPKGSNVRFEVARNNASVHIHVSDLGIGIPPETIAHLFEPFHRATNVGDIRGTGLGLAIVKESVDRHHGTIECHSVVDEGTTFTVQLPITAPSEA